MKCALLLLLLVCLALEGRAMRDDPGNLRSEKSQGEQNSLLPSVELPSVENPANRGLRNKILLKASKSGVSYLLPGSQEYLSAFGAQDKVERLKSIVKGMKSESSGESSEESEESEESEDDDDDDDEDEPVKNDKVDISDVKSAIEYVIKKKSKKAKRKMVLGTAKVGVAVGVATSGATVGSIIPVGGTILGGTAGWGAGVILSPAVTASDFLKRGAKKAYKKKRGRQGKKRKESAFVLFHSAMGGAGTKHKREADEALFICLGRWSEYRWMKKGKGPDGKTVAMSKEEKDEGGYLPDGAFYTKWLDRIAARLKSN